MKVKEALDNIIKEADGFAAEILRDLVERDTPKEVIDDDYPRCICGEVQCSNVYATNNNFCPYCGQRLDWSELK